MSVYKNLTKEEKEQLGILWLPVNCLEHLVNILSFSSKDWSKEPRDIWIYGIICGWDEDSLEELKWKYNLKSIQIKVMRKLHKQFNKLKELNKDDLI